MIMYFIDGVAFMFSPHENRTHPTTDEDSWIPTIGGVPKAKRFAEMLKKFDRSRKGSPKNSA